MKVTVCDVCEQRVEGLTPEWIEAVIPAVMIGELGEKLHVDICSLECLGVISGATPDAEEEQEPEQDRQITLPKRSTPEDSMESAGQMIPSNGNLQKVRYISPEESEELTGVKKRY